MIIQKIQKNKIYIENSDEVIEISPDIRMMFLLKDGKDISNDYEDIIYEAAFSKGAYLLGLKERTKKELYDKLVEKYKYKKSILKAVERLEELGYVNDVSYAMNYIINKKIGNQRLIFELKNRGISKENIDLAFEELSENNEDNIEDEKLEKAIRKINKKDENKLVMYLVRQGFKLDKIYSKLREIKENE